MNFTLIRFETTVPSVVVRVYVRYTAHEGWIHPVASDQQEVGFRVLCRREQTFVSHKLCVTLCVHCILCTPRRVVDAAYAWSM